MLLWKLLALLAAASHGATESVNCAARKEKVWESVICVCNSTYCDTLERKQPDPGQYVQYTSSKDGLRFSKSGGEVQNNITKGTGYTLLDVNSGMEYQTLEGIGGTVTDAAGINWLSLSPLSGQNIIKSYFSENGLEYNMIRVPIGGSDFSTHAYAYNELPENDVQLSNFTLSPEDFDYKLPMIKAAQLAAAPSDVPVYITAATYKPPVWMKTNVTLSGYSSLKLEYYQTYADYHLKFVEEYGARGVNVWAITTTNEPVNGVVPVPLTQAKWVVNNLGPTIRNSEYADTKILAVDDQRYTTVPLWIQRMVSTNASVLDYLSGVAVDYCYGDSVPALVPWTHDLYPQLSILATERCKGLYPWQVKKVELGSWTRATNYIKNILQDFNNWAVSWIDLNLCLNAEGGPNWTGNRDDSPIIVFPEKDEFIKQPIFYAMGHIAKFLPRGSVRLDVKQTKSLFAAGVDHVAFRTPHPRDTIAIVLYNSGAKKTVRVVVDKSKQVTLQLPAASISSVEIKL